MFHLEWDVIVASALLELHRKCGINTVSELQLLKYERALVLYLKKKGVSVALDPPYLELMDRFQMQYQALFTFDESTKYTEYLLRPFVKETHILAVFGVDFPPEISEALQNILVQNTLIHSRHCGNCKFCFSNRACSIQSEEKERICEKHEYDSLYLKNQTIPKRFYISMKRDKNFYKF